MTHTSNTAPQTWARIGGALYLVIIVTGIFGEMFARDSIIVSGDAAATAQNIANSELLWRVGITGDLLMHVCDVPLMLIFYLLLRPVDRNLALLAVLFNIVQSAVLVATKMNLFTPLFLLGGAAYLNAFDVAQLQALSYVSIRMDAYGFGVGLIFFGFECLVVGYLIRRSDFLPGILGVLMQIAGACYLIDSFALTLAPAFANRLFPWILAPCFIGETSLCLWLLIKGVDVRRWNERAGAEHGIAV
ncbi:MAG TPA: DUF4386 domain-containing protein [Rhodanobacteraceae bacterium]